MMTSRFVKSVVTILCLSLLTTVLIAVDLSSKSEALYNPDYGSISGGVYDGKKFTPISATISGSLYTSAYGGYFSISNVKPGFYSLTASKSGYYSSTKSVYVYKGQHASVSFYLTPMPGTDTGSIGGGVYDAKTYAPITTATVQGSGLYISAYGGYFSKSNVDPGYYSLTASASGYYSSTKSVYVYENQKTTVTFYLTPTGTAGGGGGSAQAPTIRINTPANGATVKDTLTISGTMTGVTAYSVIHVYLNNVYQGDIQGSERWSIGPVDISAWPEGQYTVSVQADNGQKSQMVSVTFKIGAQAQQPQQPQQPMNPTNPTGTGDGSQEFQRGIIAGSVYISGTFKGIQDATVSIGTKTTITDSAGSYTFTDLDDGKYTIFVSKPDYLPSWANVTITNGGTIVKDLYLEPADNGSAKIDGGNLSRGSIMGRVCEFNTSLGISGVNISINGSEYSAITGEFGEYVLTDIGVGEYNITASKEGYISNTTSIEIKELQTTVHDTYLKTVENSRPFAFLVVHPLNASVGEMVVFNANDSYDPGGGALEYLFDFGDGNVTTWTPDPVQTHQYTKEGVYYVSLIVRNGLGFNSSNPTKISIFVGNQTNTLIPVLTVDYTTRKIGQEIFFDGLDSKSLSDIPITDYLFDFGDEENTDWTNSSMTRHTYDDEGEYTASLKVRDADGVASTERSEVLITILKENNPPIARFTASRSKAAPGERVFFDASTSFDPDNDNLKYYFIYGDGKYSGWIDVPVTSHIYTQSRTYSVGLVVKDDKDALGNVAKGLTITTTNIDAEMKLIDEKTQVGDIVFANPGDVVLYKLNITNLGEYEDVIDIDIINETWNWNIEIINPNTMLPLVDTNKNKITDVGAIESQECKEVLIKATVPKNCSAGAINTTTLTLSGVSRSRLLVPNLSELSRGNQTKNFTVKIATYPDFSIAERDAVKLSSKEVSVGDKLKISVNVANIGSFVENNTTNITVIAYDGDVTNGKEIGRKTVPLRVGGEKTSIECTFDRPGKHFISVQVIASSEVNETFLSNNIVANNEVVVLSTVEPVIGASDLLLLGVIVALCAVIAVNQYFLFWKRKETTKKKQGGLVVYKKRN